jgi:hypothetical protein
MQNVHSEKSAERERSGSEVFCANLCFLCGFCISIVETASIVELRARALMWILQQDTQIEHDCF